MKRLKNDISDSLLERIQKAKNELQVLITDAALEDVNIDINVNCLNVNVIGNDGPEYVSCVEFFIERKDVI